jgi:hypothetical protein
MDISRQFINNPIRVWLTILLLGMGDFRPAEYRQAGRSRLYHQNRRGGHPLPRRIRSAG